MAAVLAALVFGLGANVTRLRAATLARGGTQLPTDPADPLLNGTCNASVGTGR